MKKKAYLEMLLNENNDDTTKKLYSDVLDCLDIALSQEPDDFEIVDTTIGLKELFSMIATKAKETRGVLTGFQCVGPFEAAEMFAVKFGAKYERLSKKQTTPVTKLVSLEDFL